MSVAHRLLDKSDLEERGFVVGNWADSYRLAHAAGLIRMSRWFPVMLEELTSIVCGEQTKTWLAYEAREPAFLYGFLVAGVAARPYVYYVFVKHNYRRARGRLFDQGVARGLFAAAGIDPRQPFEYACKTPVLGRLAGQIPGGRWNPLPARFENHDEREDREAQGRGA